MKPRIFIVEDEKIVAEDVRLRLEAFGFPVVGMASSGTEALNEVKTLAPDLILMDIRIQGDLNGIEVAIAMQKLFSDPLPIVFLTGFDSKVFEYLNLMENFTYLNKPFSDEMLLSAIDRVFKCNDGKFLGESASPA